MKSRIVFVLLVTVFLLPFVLADSCSSGCESGQVCISEECVDLCLLGDAACSDGLDNDGVDDGIDYLGACNTPEGFVACDANTLLTPKDCEKFCNENYATGSYVFPDEQCRSPLDHDENADPTCADNVDNDGNGFCDVDGCCSFGGYATKSECLAVSGLIWYEQDSNCEVANSDGETGGTILFAPNNQERFFARALNWFAFWN